MDITGRYQFTLKVTATGLTVSKHLACGGGGRRCAIAGLSAKSGARLRALLGSIVFQRVDFVTLTYHENQTDKTRGYKDLRAWHKRLTRAVGSFGVVWRAEAQKRGAVHFHCFCVDPPQGATPDGYRDAWLAVTESEGDWAARSYGVHTKTVDTLTQADAGVIVTYMVKYAAKAGGVDGRQWGVLGRSSLREVSKSRTLDEGEFMALAEVLRHAYGGHAGDIDGGGTYVAYRPGGMGKDGSQDWQKIVKTVLPWIEFAV